MKRDLIPDYVTRSRDAANVGRNIVGDVVLVALMLGAIALMAAHASKPVENMVGTRTVAMTSDHCLTM